VPTAIPLIDLSGPEAGARIDRACGTVGFFVATGHGVPPPIVDGAWAAARDFFDRTLDTKMEARREGNPYGFEPVRHEALGRTLGETSAALPDPKQTFNLGPPYRGPDSGFGSHERIWPTSPYELRPNLLNYYAEMERLARRILELFAEAMGQERRFFEPFVDRHVSALRILDYPASAGSDPLRAGAHTDYGTLTLLRADPEVGGLEVSDGSGGWVAVPAVADSFVVNIGDLMHRWSNGRWRSTLHRVIGDPQGRRRNSIAFFHNPNWDALVEPILLSPDEQSRFEPVVAGPWLETKVGRAHS